MSSDIMLDDNTVTVQAWDLKLDARDRRKNQTPYRRALVHDFNDGLTLNWANDYPGGVTINGDVKLGGGKLVFPTSGSISGSGECIWGVTIDGNLTLSGTDLILSRNKTALNFNQDDLVIGGTGLSLDQQGRADFDSIIIFANKSCDIQSPSTFIGVDVPDRVTGVLPQSPGLQVSVSPWSSDSQRVICSVDFLGLKNPRQEIDGDRKALAHTDKDELVLNQDALYKGGVKSEGNLTVTGSLTCNGQLQPHEILLKGGMAMTQGLTIKPDSLEIGSGLFPSITKLSIRPNAIVCKEPKKSDLDLVAAVRQLLDEVATLKSKIAQLENTHR